MKFGSWTYDSAKVNLKFYHDIEKFDLKSYVNSNEWNIIDNSATRNTEKYGKFHFFGEKRDGKKGLLMCRLLSGYLRGFEI